MAERIRHQENANATSFMLPHTQSSSKTTPRSACDGANACRVRLRRCCSRPGNDGLLWRTNFNGHVQNFRDLCWRRYLLRRSHFRGNPHDVGSLSGRDPRTLRRAVWCRSARLGSRMDRSFPSTSRKPHSRLASKRFTTEDRNPLVSCYPSGTCNSGLAAISCWS
jgi:hypothetical protein